MVHVLRFNSFGSPKHPVLTRMVSYGRGTSVSSSWKVGGGGRFILREVPGFRVQGVGVLCLSAASEETVVLGRGAFSFERGALYPGTSLIRDYIRNPTVRLSTALRCSLGGGRFLL